MKRLSYIAFLYKDDGSEQYNVIIPDVEGAYTYGNDFMHTVTMAKEVLDLSLEDVTDLPESHPLEYFTSKKLEELDIPINAIPRVIEYTQPEKNDIINNANNLIQLKERFWKEVKSSKEVTKFGLFYGVEHIMKDSTLVFAKNKIFEKHDKITDKVIQKLDKELKNKYDVICDDLEDYENWEIHQIKTGD
jgi:predicted RNase H-like HicB family nuclease